MASYFSEREVRLARSFIKAIKGNALNGYLLLAVITWQRHMSKESEAFFKSLSKYGPSEAGLRLARKLITQSGLSAKDYRGVLTSLRRSASGQTAQVGQARDFLLAIQMSAWTSTHYGYKPYKAGYWLTRDLPNGSTETIWVPEQQEVDPLAVTWAKMTGYTIPKSYFIDGTTTTVVKPPPPPPPKPRQPRSLVNVLPRPDYILPYAADNFYDARKHLDHPDNLVKG